MSIRTIILAGLFGAATAARATIVVSNVAATNVTTTSAWANATLVSTNGTTNAVTATLYYGTVDGTTNTSGVNGWANTNSYGAAAVGPLTVQATALTASHKYFYRWYVAEGTGTAWATPSTFLWTLSTSPTSTPTPSSIAVHAGTNGVLKAPTNFFMANSQQVAQAAAAAGALTNETDPVWTSEKSGYATGTPVYAESDPVWEAAKSGYATGTPVYAESDPVWEAAKSGYATGTPVYVESDPVWEAAKSGYATGTPVYAESDPVWEAAKSGYATGTPVYVESDPVWEAAKAGYATGTPVYAESDPVWSAARTNYDDATNALDGRVTALDAASTGAVAVLTGRVLALDAASTGAVPILQSSTQALNGRLTSLDAASTGAVAVLQGATNTLDGRVTALEGGGAVSNWSAHPARQIVDVAGNSLSNVYSITALEPGWTVLDESFTNDVFTAGTWTNTVGVWGWSPSGELIDATPDCCASNTTATITAGRNYRAVIHAQYGYFEVGGGTNWLIFTCGGVNVTLTNAINGSYVTTNDITATTDGAPALSAANNIGTFEIKVSSLLLTDITPSNSVYIPRLESDRVTLGGVARTNWPETNAFADLAAATNALDARVTAVESAPAELKTNLYAFLDLDPTAAGGWTDFEIKFSTNNFTNLVYYYKSTGANAHTEDGLSVDDPAPFAYYTLTGGHTNGVADVRFWHKQTPHESIYGTMADPTNGVVGGIEFWPSHEVNFPTAAWMQETNSHLVGSWVRIDGIGPETDGAGRQVWRPVAIRWADNRRTR